MIPNPPAEGTPLPSEDTVLRLALDSHPDFEGGDVLENAFTLSTEERDRTANPRQGMSAWNADWTTPEQAVEFADNPRRRLVIKLPVAAVRAVQVDEYPDARVDVCWDPLRKYFDALGTPHPGDPTPPGAAGHCAMVGLGEPLARPARKKLRRLITALANRADIEKQFVDLSSVEGTASAE